MHRYQFNKLPGELAERTIRYAEANWRMNKGIDFDDVLKTLPPRLRADIKMALHGAVMNAIPFFKSSDPSFMRALVVQLQAEACLAGDYVFKTGELADAMYFIHEGFAHVLRDGRVSLQLGPKSFFGEKALLQGQRGGAEGGVRKGRRREDVQARTFCYLYVLSAADFDEVLHSFPEVRRHIEDLASKREAIAHFRTEIQKMAEYASCAGC